MHIRKKFFTGKSWWYGCYLLAITIVALEVILRIYYPFQHRVRGHSWKLAANTTYRLSKPFNKKLDDTILNKRNSIGFRGEDPAPGMDSRLTILAIGGSTTACTFLTEGKTWPDVLGARLKNQFPLVWINNAGIDGNSSYGNLRFMHDYLPGLSFKPKIILLLIGANDVDREDLAYPDSSLDNGIFAKSGRWLNDHSETLALIRDLKWELHPADIFTDKQHWNFTNFQEVHLSPGTIQQALQKQATPLHAFRDRVNRIITWCVRQHIQPMLITQPLVFGDGTRENGSPAIDFHVFNERENGQLFWLKLKLYNEVTKNVAAENQVPCIDLATLMPKDTLYYYDIVHYTNAGAQKVADLIYEEMEHYLAGKYPGYLKK